MNRLPFVFIVHPVVDGPAVPDDWAVH